MKIVFTLQIAWSHFAEYAVTWSHWNSPSSTVLNILKIGLAKYYIRPIRQHLEMVKLIKLISKIVTKIF